MDMLPPPLNTGRTKAVAQRCFVKKVFLEISQNPQENNCARVSLIKLQGLSLQLYLKIDSGGGVFL